MATEYGLPIKIVSQQTGLSTHLIRMWERRYGVVTPSRTPTNRRLYSVAEIERLTLLGRLVKTGRSIGSIAQLETSTLRQIIHEDQFKGSFPAARNSGPLSDSHPERIIETLMSVISQLNPEHLDLGLRRAALDHSHQVVIEQILIPLLHKVGDLWQQGTLTVVHEHMASVIIRNFLTHLVEAYRPLPHAPLILLTTPSGQQHEFGALAAAATAAAAGWQTIYLGPNLPIEEIALAARRLSANIVGLSLVFPRQATKLGDDLILLRKLLPDGAELILGGTAAPDYQQEITRAGGLLIVDLYQLRMRLEMNRQRQPQPRQRP